MSYAANFAPRITGRSGRGGERADVRDRRTYQMIPRTARRRWRRMRQDIDEGRIFRS